MRLLLEMTLISPSPITVTALQFIPVVAPEYAMHMSAVTVLITLAALEFPYLPLNQCPISLLPLLNAMRLEQLSMYVFSDWLLCLRNMHFSFLHVLLWLDSPFLFSIK